MTVTPLVCAISLQFVAYDAVAIVGRDGSRPRNPAKFVTMEWSTRVQSARVAGIVLVVENAGHFIDRPVDG